MFSKSTLKSPAAAESGPPSVHGLAAGTAWEGRLQAALGNDTALLALAIDAPSVDQKLTAVLALASEDGLRTAEREFRKHDRRVHSVAKQRYETLVKQRETRAAAVELIQAAAALADLSLIPANRLVELNQAWELLDPALVAEEQKAEFARNQASLAELMRTRAEHQRSGSRWSAVARQALAELNSAGASALAAGADPGELAARLAAASATTRAALATKPASNSSPSAEDGALAALGAAMQSALQEAAQIEARLALLSELLEGSTPQSSGSNGGQPGEPTAASLQAAVERWRELPSMADQRIESALSLRFDEWLRLQTEACKNLQKQDRLRVSEKDKALLQARLQALMEKAVAAEAALGAGHLAEAGKQLAMLQTAVGKGGVSAALQKRLVLLQAEFSRLKGWQHWGGGRVRDDLVTEAESLAASTVVPEGARAPKLPLKQLEKSIEQLRVRWKELDRLGGATSKPLWQRFEGALKTAYLPVAAHLARLNEARQENLAARKNLLAALDTLRVTVDEQGLAPDWKEVGRALNHFQTEWRKLGPLEHTVAHKSQPALVERLKASLARLEVPLGEVHATAQAQRQLLVERAKALAEDAQGRNLLVKLRELQSQWQSHAKSQPLPRKLENHLWAEFRAASDALMNLREAAFSARDAGFKANQAAREALLARLEELHQDTPPADLKRVLATVDTEWRTAGEAPRNQAARLESRYRAAREKALEHVAGSAQRAWNRSCDALLAKLALCAELETAALDLPTALADLQARWADLPSLPPRWEQALQARFQSGCKRDGADAATPDTVGSRNGSFDQLLLQLEASLDIPSPEAFQMARRTLKLLAMKNAMEGRRSATAAPPDKEGLLAAAFGCRQLDVDQRQRLEAVIAALRRSGSGILRG